MYMQIKRHYPPNESIYYIKGAFSFWKTQNLAYIIYESRLSYIEIFLLFSLLPTEATFDSFKAEIRVHRIKYSSSEGRGQVISL